MSRKKRRPKKGRIATKKESQYPLKINKWYALRILKLFVVRTGRRVRGAGQQRGDGSIIVRPTSYEVSRINRNVFFCFVFVLVKGLKGV